jgi:hypothetical protein
MRYASVLNSPLIRLLNDLERTVQQLWTFEPLCSTDDRRALLDRLGAVCARVERLALQHDFRPDEAVDLRELDGCREEVADLAARWRVGFTDPLIAA